MGTISGFDGSADSLKASSRFRSAELANPYEAGTAYLSLASAVNWNIACRAEGASHIAAKDAHCAVRIELMFSLL